MPLLEPVSEQAMQYLVALLSAPSSPVRTVHRDVGRPLQENELDAIALDEDDAETSIVDHGSPGEDGQLVTILEDVVSFRTEIWVLGTNAEDVIRRRNRLYAWVVTQIASDRTLGGLVDRVTERSRTISRARAKRMLQKVTVTWEARLQRRENDPRSLPDEA